VKHKIQQLAWRIHTGQKHRFLGIIVVLLVAIIGVTLLLIGHAASPYASQNAANGTVASPAVTKNDSTASNGKSVLFGPNTNANDLQGAVLGIDVPPESSDLTTAVQEIGKTPALVDQFIQWQDSKDNYILFPQSWVDSIVQMGSTPMITWEPDAGAAGPSSNQADFNLATILSGKYDSFVEQWSTAAANDDHTVYLRFMHEMNDSWAAWGAGVNGNTPAQYIKAYQRVWDIFHCTAVTASSSEAAYTPSQSCKVANNVQFIWCIGANILTPAPSVYFPGDQYISWVSIDGYNRDKPWNSFDTIFSQAYQDVTSISNHPVLIAETASVEDPSNPQNKADWITTSFLQTIPNDFPKIKAINYWDDDSNGYSYAIDSSTYTRTAVQNIYKNSYYQDAAPKVTLSY
jgi:beta-mannanase